MFCATINDLVYIVWLFCSLFLRMRLRVCVFGILFWSTLFVLCTLVLAVWVLCLCDFVYVCLRLGGYLTFLNVGLMAWVLLVWIEVCYCGLLIMLLGLFCFRLLILRTMEIALTVIYFVVWYLLLCVTICFWFDCRRLLYLLVR